MSNRGNFEPIPEVKINQFTSALIYESGILFIRQKDSSIAMAYAPGLKREELVRPVKGRKQNAQPQRLSVNAGPPAPSPQASNEGDGQPSVLDGMFDDDDEDDAGLDHGLLGG